MSEESKYIQTEEDTNQKENIPAANVNEKESTDDKENVSVKSDKTNNRTERPAVFNDVRFTLYHTFRVESEEKDPWIRHIEVLSDGHILLADRYNRQLLLYDSNGIRLKQVKLSSGPWSLAITNNNLAAVTLPDDKVVAFITADTLKGSHKIQVHDNCRGIACIDNKLIVNCVTNGLKLLTMNGRTLKVFPKYVGYMSLLRGPNELLLCSLFAEDRFVCMDLKGNVKYQFADQTLSGPCSFAADRVQDCLYVVGHHGNNIHMIGDRGAKSRILMSRKEGIDRPWAIGYDSGAKMMFISNFGGKNITVLKKVEDV